MRFSFHKFSTNLIVLAGSLLISCTSGGGNAPLGGVESPTLSLPKGPTAASETSTAAATGQDGILTSMPTSVEMFPDLTRLYTVAFPDEKVAADPVYYFSPANLEGSAFPSPGTLRKLPPIEKRTVAYTDLDCPECVSQIVRILYLGAFTPDELNIDNFGNPSVEELSYEFFLRVKMGDTYPGAPYRDFRVGTDQKIQCSAMELHGYGMYWLLMLPADPELAAKLGPSALDQAQKVESDQIFSEMISKTYFLRALRVMTPPASQP